MDGKTFIRISTLNKMLNNDFALPDAFSRCIRLRIVEFSVIVFFFLQQHIH